MAAKTIETLEQDVKTEHDLYLHALADFDNYRRRIDREHTQSRKRRSTGDSKVSGSHSILRFMKSYRPCPLTIKRRATSCGKHGGVTNLTRMCCGRRVSS